MLFTLILALPFLSLSLGAPAPLPLFGIHINSGPSTNAKTTAIAAKMVDSQLVRPALFSRLAYCSAVKTKSLTCGAPCDAVKGISVVTAGGDDGKVPGFFIATDPSTQSVIVAHQGTDSTNIMSIANDVKFVQKGMDAKVFPKADKDAKVHDGFQDAQVRTADTVLKTVQDTLTKSKFKRVLVTGHSLGAAIAMLDGVMLKMALPANVEVSAVVFGLPRVGNEAFANMVDKLLPSFTHVTNQKDPVPLLPPKLLDFQHPAGEVHISSVDSKSGKAALVACPGQENKNCADNNSLLTPSISNHEGPYFNNISFGSHACPV
ncbi:hypothetical protein QCA50_011207 [Cerrena zonata]|uniref:Fungal lipase-type domain-containing protein n=1 Tax=Cerrena zonata TaxID=2478898 RepID=A0AAW0FXC6_9APHY